MIAEAKKDKAAMSAKLEELTARATAAEQELNLKSEAEIKAIGASGNAAVAEDKKLIKKQRDEIKKRTAAASAGSAASSSAPHTMMSRSLAGHLILFALLGIARLEDAPTAPWPAPESGVPPPCPPRPLCAFRCLTEKRGGEGCSKRRQTSGPYWGGMWSAGEA